MLDVVCL